MKKFTTYLLIFILTISMTYAEIPLYARYLTKGIEIISPDGDKKTYTNIDEIPEIQYASKIFAYGMVIMSFYCVDIILKNRQGIFVAKSPITQELVIAKVENSNNGPISIDFDKVTKAELSPDAKISFKYVDSTITLKVLMGTISMDTNGNNFELYEGEAFIYKYKGENDAI
ncbi:MAG: hypothetical protein PHH62_07225 [Endomicrobiaceae bacterium]|nr:hypothetical protein [Endomicrobiaceae bacterium]